MIAIIAIIMATGMKANQNVQLREKFENTIVEMQMLRRAIIGNSLLRTNGIRNDFGYVGEMGRLPTSLSELMSQGLQSAVVYNDTLHLSSGWAGPYLQETFTNYTSNPLTDEFDKLYQWDTTELPNSGDTISAKLISFGANKVVNGTGIDADITVEIFKREWRGNISGKAYDSAGKKLKKATVKLYYPDGSGGISTKTKITNGKGVFSFFDIPFGPRSLSFTPKGGAEAPPRQIRIDAAAKILSDINNIGSILLASSSVSGPSNNYVNVNLTNNLGKDVTLIDWKAVYSGFTFYDLFNIGGSAHWSSSSDKAESGVQLSSKANFTSYNFVDASTIIFQMRAFQDGSDTDVNMSLTSFTVTLYLSSGASYDISFTP
ncbi:hypothetical protein E3V33_01660 [Candidatus Marinimicrobia bacterium MT.SAG.4]|nr:hypothetical protein E3V33_01660 [Candidatus Marinimicrobia bacterium MT.SAG.4]